MTSQSFEHGFGYRQPSGIGDFQYEEKDFYDYLGGSLA